MFQTMREEEEKKKIRLILSYKAVDFMMTFSSKNSKKKRVQQYYLLSFAILTKLRDGKQCKGEEYNNNLFRAPFFFLLEKSTILQQFTRKKLNL